MEKTTLTLDVFEPKSHFYLKILRYEKKLNPGEFQLSVKYMHNCSVLCFDKVKGNGGKQVLDALQSLNMLFWIKYP